MSEAVRNGSEPEQTPFEMQRFSVLSLRTLRLTSPTRTRRGSIVMFVAMAVLVVGACLALVFDRLWLDAAQVELQAAAEAAALAGAGQLASDARLNPKSIDLATPAREAAIAIAQKNFSVGAPVELQSGEQGDVQVGTIEMSPETGESIFVADTERPTTCVVKAARLRSRGNPVALLIRTASGRSSGDAQAFAEASVDNRIIGVQPSDNSPVPALPLHLAGRARSLPLSETEPLFIDPSAPNRNGLNWRARPVAILNNV